MKLGISILILFLAMVAAFVALNWGAVTAQTTLDLGFAAIEAPLGLILLGVALALFVPVVVYADFQHRTMLRAAASNAKKLHSQRDLAERAEASRYAHLRGFLEEEFQKNADRESRFKAEVLRRLDEIKSDAHAIAARREFEVESSKGSAGSDRKMA
jgi:hypothetical protein